MTTDDFGGVAVATPPASDEFGGVRVAQPNRDEFGGMVVASKTPRKSGPYTLPQNIAFEQQRLEGNRRLNQPIEEYAAEHPTESEKFVERITPKLATTRELSPEMPEMGDMYASLAAGDVKGTETRTIPPEKQEQLGRYIAAKRAPEAQVNGVLGDLWAAAAKGPLKTYAEASGNEYDPDRLRKVLGKTPEEYAKWEKDLGVENDSRAVQLAKGAGEEAGELVDFFLSPAGVATMGMNVFPKVVQRGISLAFTGQMLSQEP